MFKKNKPKIFCISMQRTGTTSVGQFFKDFGYHVADWPMSHKNKWSFSWEQGDFESIFNSKDFKNNQVFEDDPWWLSEFYKVLYHRFPNAKFILLTRDSQDWFNSMLSHSGGKILGNTKRHCKVYRRESEFNKLVTGNDLLNYNEKAIDNLLSLEGKDEHYKAIYETRNKEVKMFFEKYAPDSFFSCELKDQLKWQKLGDFVGVNVPDNYAVHSNKSEK